MMTMSSGSRYSTFTVSGTTALALSTAGYEMLFSFTMNAAGKSLRIHPQPESDGVPIQKRFVNLVLIGVAFAVVLQEIEELPRLVEVVKFRLLQQTLYLA